MQGKLSDHQTEDCVRINKPTVLFIRHGESEAHIGKAASHTEEIRLTQKGEKQAQEIAKSLQATPDLIVTSPYLRAWGTASPTLQRFSSTSHQIWPAVQEFTYLGSLAGICSTKQERLVLVKNYWERCDPEYQDGNGESFSQFVHRAREVLDRLRSENGFIVVFTHEQFIRIAQCVLAWEMVNTPECMKRFRDLLQKRPLPYGYVWKPPLFPANDLTSKNMLQDEYALPSTPVSGR